MVTYEDLDRDPWNTYPVNKEELRELIAYRSIYTRYDDIDPDHLEVHHIKENLDGSADVELSLGRNVAREFIKEGFLSCLRKSIQNMGVREE